MNHSNDEHDWRDCEPPKFILWLLTIGSLSVVTGIILIVTSWLF